MKADPRKETGIKLVAVEISLTFGNRKWQPHKNSGAKDEEAKFNKRTKYKMRIRVFPFIGAPYETLLDWLMDHYNGLYFGPFLISR